MHEESTTADLVERWRRSHEAFARGDLDAAISFYSPDAEWDAAPGVGTFEGRTAIRGFWEDWRFVSFEDFETEQEECHDLGNGVVFAVLRQVGRPAGSASRVEGRYAVTVLWAGGMIVRVIVRDDIGEARAAAERLAEEREPMHEESTTPDLVELSRRFVEAGNRRDLDAMQSFFAPDAVWETAGFAETFEGVEAIRGFWQDWLAGYEELWGELEEPLDLGNGVVFGVLIQKARPLGSGGEVRHRNAFVVVWVENLMVRVTNYADIAEARAAAERLAEERDRR